MRDLARLPKAHLHLHAESAIRWSTLREFAASSGLAIPDHLANGRVRFRGFRDFADQAELVRACLRRSEHFARIGRELCEDEARQGVRYLEVTFTAASHGERLGALEMPLEALLRGLEEGGAAAGLEWRVILDHSRRQPVERFQRTLDLAKRYAAHGVVGIGLAGDEAYSLAPFAGVLAEAAEAGLRLVHHAGETHGPASIREALEVGRAERLGHAIRALDDPALVAALRERAIPLEVCPSSNVALSLVDSLDQHPLPRLLAAGLTVTLNADIPALVGTSLLDEYARVRDTFDYDDPTLAALARASLSASFAPTPTRARLLHQVDAWLG